MKLRLLSSRRAGVNSSRLTTDAPHLELAEEPLSCVAIDRRIVPSTYDDQQTLAQRLGSTKVERSVKLLYEHLTSCLSRYVENVLFLLNMLVGVEGCALSDRLKCT